MTDPRPACAVGQKSPEGGGTDLAVDLVNALFSKPARSVPLRMKRAKRMQAVRVRVSGTAS